MRKFLPESWGRHHIWHGVSEGKESSYTFVFWPFTLFLYTASVPSWLSVPLCAYFFCPLIALVITKHLCFWSHLHPLFLHPPSFLPLLLSWPDSPTIYKKLFLAPHSSVSHFTLPSTESLCSFLLSGHVILSTFYWRTSLFFLSQPCKVISAMQHSLLGILPHPSPHLDMQKPLFSVNSSGMPLNLKARDSLSYSVPDSLS